MNEYLDANRAKWDELVPIHLASRMYDVEAFKAGRDSLQQFERDELGDVTGKALLHLQCHFGQDTLSWARLGAIVSGLDFSSAAIQAARELAGEIGVEADFVCADLYDAPRALDGRRFDAVYTGGGAIIWLPDIERWAGVVDACLRPGGVFYLREFHPFMWVFDDDEGVEELLLRYPYFHSDEPLSFDASASYADSDASTHHTRQYSWAHPIGDVVSALAGTGLVIEFLHEFDFLEFRPFQFMVQGDDGRWRPPKHGESVPLQYSIRARKPQ